jgi:hypothetical protein
MVANGASSAPVNMVALFVAGHFNPMTGELPVHVIVAPATYNPNRSSLTPEASFLRTAVLVR